MRHNGSGTADQNQCEEQGEVTPNMSAPCNRTMIFTLLTCLVDSPNQACLENVLKTAGKMSTVEGTSLSHG